MNDYSSNFSSTTSDSSRGGTSYSKKRFRRFVKRSAVLPFVIVGIVVLGVVFLMMRNASTGSASPASVVGLASDKRADVSKPLAQQQLNKEFAFSLRDANGKEVSKLKYEIQSAELRDQIIVKGQQATAVKGRVFLILNLKITNSYDKSIQLNSRDYVRLVIPPSDEKLAPEIHNDPVEVQAISTKYTRVGFTINDTAKSYRLEVGEIEGPKETIQLNLK